MTATLAILAVFVVLKLLAHAAECIVSFCMDGPDIGLTDDEILDVVDGVFVVPETRR